MRQIITVLFSLLAVAWSRPQVIYITPSSGTEIVDSDGTIIRTYSPHEQDGIVSYPYDNSHLRVYPHGLVRINNEDGVIVQNSQHGYLQNVYGQDHVNSVTSSGFTQVHQSPVLRQKHPAVYREQVLVENPVYVKSVPQYNHFVQVPQRTIVQTPVVQQPVLVQQPVVHKTLVSQPVVHKTLVSEPVVHKTIVSEPVVHRTLVSEPVVHKTIVSEPVVHKTIVSEPVVHKTIVHQPSTIKKTIVSTRLHQTHPTPVVIPPPQVVITHPETHISPVVVPAPQIVVSQPEVHLSIPSESVSVKSTGVGIIASTVAPPVILRSSTPVPVISESIPVVSPVPILHQPIPVVSKAVVAEPVVTKTIISEPVVAKTVIAEPVINTVVSEPVVTKTVVTQPVVAKTIVGDHVVEASDAVVETKVAESIGTVTTAEESELVPLTSGKPKELEPISKVVPVKTHRISPYFIAEGPDATYVAPGTGLKGQYVHDNSEKLHDDGSYRGEFYHGIGKVIKLEKNHV